MSSFQIRTIKQAKLNTLIGLLKISLSLRLKP